MKEKYCGKCANWLPVRKFHRNNGTADGLQGWCYECMKKAGKNNTEKNKAKWVDGDPYAEDK